MVGGAGIQGGVCSNWKTKHSNFPGIGALSPSRIVCLSVAFDMAGQNHELDAREGW